MIVPWRNSVVTAVIPRMIASSAAKPAASMKSTWKSSSLRRESSSEPIAAATEIPDSSTITTR